MKKPPDGGVWSGWGSGIAPASAPGPACSAFAADGGAAFKLPLFLHGVQKKWADACQGFAASSPKRKKAISGSLDFIIESLRGFIPFSIPALGISFKPAAVLKSSQKPFLVRLWDSGCWGHGEVIAKGRQVGVRHQTPPWRASWAWWSRRQLPVLGATHRLSRQSSRPRWANGERGG